MRGPRFDPRRGAALHPRAHAGFTLMDLMVTMTLAAILAAVGTPVFYPALVQFRLNSAAEQVLGAVDYARSRAVVAGTTTRVTFDASAESLLVEEESLAIDLGTTPGTKLDAALVETKTFRPLEHPMDGDSDYLVTLASDAWAGSIDLMTAEFGANAWVTFDARGVPNIGGKVVLQSGGEAITLWLEAQSGRMAP